MKNQPAGEDTPPKEEQAAPPAAPESETEQAVPDYKDLYLRKAAEFDNFKKRVQQESSTLIRFANEDLLLAALPVMDDLERSLRSGKEMKDPAGFYRGIEMIRQKLLKILEAQGVKPLDALGKEFDVSYHDALLQMPRNDVPPHTVVEVVEQGYLLHDKVLRHAKVIVSTEPGDAVTENSRESGDSRSGDGPPPSPAS